MATRVGKYKITKRESALNLTDGGTINGSLRVTGAIHPANVIVASGSAGATGDAFTGIAGTLTEAAHAGRTILMPDVAENSTLAISTPSRAGIHYHLVYNGVADDANDMVISFSDDACYFKGVVTTFDEDLATAAATAVIPANGSSNDVLTIHDPHYYDLHMVSLSTTVMAIWGTIVSDTVAAFSDAD